MIKKYKKKPVVIEAIQFDGENYAECGEFLNANPFHTNIAKQKIYIKTLEGEITASKNDYIIKGVKGEFYPCKPDIFKQTYDEECKRGVMEELEFLKNTRKLIDEMMSGVRYISIDIGLLNEVGIELNKRIKQLSEVE